MYFFCFLVTQTQMFENMYKLGEMFKMFRHFSGQNHVDDRLSNVQISFSIQVFENVNIIRIWINSQLESHRSMMTFQNWTVWQKQQYKLELNLQNESTYMSLYRIARSLLELHKKALFLPGWSISWMIAANKQTAWSMGSKSSLIRSDMRKHAVACITSAACVELWYGLLR